MRKKGEAGFTLDGDMITVIDPAEVGQFEMPRQRGRFARNALHEIGMGRDRA